SPRRTPMRAPDVMSDWRAILAREVAAHPRGKAGVARLLGVSRAYVARAMSTGKSAFRAEPKRFIARVYDLETAVDCPAVGAKTPRADCLLANAPAPTHNPLLMRRWRVCQRCPMKPYGDGGTK
ncbi:MAG: hypothetical protein N2690_04040, partial [Rhodocyclaceae bacterium]|nr:hypothetical protein [Rhodocyclaceae bacterium]